MKVIGLDGKEYKWNYQSKKRGNASKLHQKARVLLHELFPFEVIHEEVFLPGTKTPKHKGLYGDFYIHSNKLLIEVHGEQHFKFNRFHYDNKLYFGKAKNRDNDKEVWCSINNIMYIGLKYNESDEQWTECIRAAHRGNRN